MTNDPKTVTVVENRIEPITDSAHAPIVFFDGAPTYGFNNDIVNVTLSCARFLPSVGAVDVKPVVVAHLRCDRTAAIALRDAIDSALLMGAHPQGAKN